MTRAEHNRLIAEYEERIQMRDALLGFRFLVEHAHTIEGYRGEPRTHGYIPSFPEALPDTSANRMELHVTC